RAVSVGQCARPKRRACNAQDRNAAPVYLPVRAPLQRGITHTVSMGRRCGAASGSTRLVGMLGDLGDVPRWDRSDMLAATCSPAAACGCDAARCVRVATSAPPLPTEMPHNDGHLYH